jgi:hypothetical protein
MLFFLILAADYTPGDQGPCGYDIWIAHVSRYTETYAHKRQSQYGEMVWLYSLPQDRFPMFSPCIDGWVLLLLTADTETRAIRCTDDGDRYWSD